RHGEGLVGKLADGQERPVHGDRWDGDIDSRAIEQPGIAHRLGFIDAPAHGGDDLVDDPQQVAIVLEANRGELEPAGALHEDFGAGVDQYVVDRRVLEQRLERPQTGHLVDHVGDDPVLLLLVELKLLGAQGLPDQSADLLAEILKRQLLDGRQVDLVEQPLMQPHLYVGEAGRRLRGDDDRRLRLADGPRRLHPVRWRRQDWFRWLSQSTLPG